MNILPKKRWHVRTKDNIARVRRDEAQAAEEEKQILQRAKLAEQEARTAFLRNKAKERFHTGDSLNDDSTSVTENKNKKLEENLKEKASCDIYTNEGNINFFKDIEAGKQIGGTNKEYENEKKEEQEKYEKQIGLLTYLGQDSLELLNKGCAWYENDESKVTLQKDDDKEVGLKSKNLLDPIHDIMKYSGRKITNISKNAPTGNSNENENDLVASNVLHKNKNIVIDRRQKKKKKSDKRNKHKKKKSKHKHSEKSKSYRQSVKVKKSSKRKRDSDSESDDCKNVKRHKSNKSRTSKYSSESENESRIKSVKKCKKRYSSSSSNEISSSDSEYEREQENKKRNLETLRAERLKREEKEKMRAERLLAGKNPDEVEIKKPIIKQKYSSQFNPEIARQNKEETKLQAGVKYWQQ